MPRHNLNENKPATAHAPIPFVHSLALASVITVDLRGARCSTAGFHLTVLLNVEDGSPGDAGSGSVVYVGAVSESHRAEICEWHEAIARFEILL